ncbi:AtzE family amidohydrolase [Comamonas endophytica]|uniref:AtzE family amidohydrolase n=1 Tax=Comamonas endophytica TaxID=2949090 RepID=A0ABY6GDV3_9BURK|nr:MULTISPECIES: AtzE family amidohydrolase [unclassified Acidovorax]MCD2513005.1 AtzE family amidohydrolase [Acidovorax sp. D4N7]UYG52654.1 AtzE family amidohydrolase [Acidovorax sp. 5MLIR]
MNATITPTGPAFASAEALAAQVRSGERSATSIACETLERIAAQDPQLNCFTAVTAERALAEAAAVDAAFARGESLPPLAGVPYAVKNLYDVAGLATLAGGQVNAADPPATQDALLVRRLRQAGGVLVGALNMDEHAYGFTTENSHYGSTRNPHDRTRVAGGSSGGSAAAVAAGLVPLTLGSDTNGSVRVPASLCGVFGLKPTYGRLPRSGTYPFVHSLDHLGLFAGSTRDLALAYDLMQGGDPADVACAQRPAEPVSTALQWPAGLRIGILGGWFHAQADAAARQALDLAAAALGASDEVEFRGAETARTAAFLITAAEGGALHRERLRSRYAEYEPHSRDRLVAGSLIPVEWVVQAQRLRRQCHQEAMALFSRYDLLLAPATPFAATPLGAATVDLHGQQVPPRAGLGLLTQPLSCIGLPVCTAPLWPALAGGLPLGVQLIAAPWREDLCLMGSAALEARGLAGTRLPQA